MHILELSFERHPASQDQADLAKPADKDHDTISQPIVSPVNHNLASTSNNDLITSQPLELEKLAFCYQKGTFHWVQNGRLIPLNDKNYLRLKNVLVTALLVEEQHNQVVETWLSKTGEQPGHKMESTTGEHEKIDFPVVDLHLSNDLSDMAHSSHWREDPLSFLFQKGQQRTLAKETKAAAIDQPLAGNDLPLSNWRLYAGRTIEVHNLSALQPFEHELPVSHDEQGNILFDLGMQHVVEHDSHFKLCKHK